MIFMNFYTFWRLELAKLTIFRIPKLAKTADFTTISLSPILISRKIWDRENSQISTLCFVNCNSYLFSVRISLWWRSSSRYTCFSPRHYKFVKNSYEWRKIQDQENSQRRHLDQKSPKLQSMAKSSAIVASPCFKISRLFIIHKC